MASIEKMFHQVIVDFIDRDALRFIWRSNTGENFQDIQMNIHLFWKVDSPSCCIWTLNKPASDSILKIFSRAEEAVEDNFYTDDYLDSFHTVQEAIKVSSDVTNAQSKRVFCLTKWISNDQQTLPSQEVSYTLINLDFGNTSTKRALRIYETQVQTDYKSK